MRSSTPGSEAQRSPTGSRRRCRRATGPLMRTCGRSVVRKVVDRSNGALDYHVVSSSFDANIDATGPCSVAGVDVCGEVSDYRDSITSAFASDAASARDSPVAHAAIDGVLAQQATNAGLTRVDNVLVDPFSGDV